MFLWSLGVAYFISLPRVSGAPPALRVTAPPHGELSTGSISPFQSIAPGLLKKLVVLSESSNNVVLVELLAGYNGEPENSALDCCSNDWLLL